MGVLTISGVFGLFWSIAASVFQRPPDPEPQLIAVRNTVAPRRRAYGRVRVKDCILAELKVENPTGDGVLYVASIICQGEIDDIEEHRFNDQITRIRESDGAVTYPGVWWDNNRVYLHYHFGADSQVAD